MIDRIYRTLLVLLNKEKRGTVTPVEFNLLANKVQSQILYEYFSGEAVTVFRASKGYNAKGYANLEKYIDQVLDYFSKESALTISTDKYPLPSDIYLLNDNGLTYVDASSQVIPIEYSDKKTLNYSVLSAAPPSLSFPVFERLDDSNVKVYPSTIITAITCKYTRLPLAPNWTFDASSGAFNISDVNYQDFELSPSEEFNILNKMMYNFGIILRDADIVNSLSQQQSTAQAGN